MLAQQELGLKTILPMFLAFCVKMLGAEFLGVCFKKYSSLNFEKIREIIKIKITKNNTYTRLNFKPKVTKSMVKMIGFIRGEVKR